MGHAFIRTKLGKILMLAATILFDHCSGTFAEAWSLRDYAGDSQGRLLVDPGERHGSGSGFDTSSGTAKDLFSEVKDFTFNVEPPQRRDQPQHGGHPGGDLRLGRRRHLAGEWAKSAQVLQVERNIYEQLTTAQQDYPVIVDVLQVNHNSKVDYYLKDSDKPLRNHIFELFAGEAGVTQNARHYQLNALEPIDYRFGWDLYEPEQRAQVLATVDQHKPLMVIIGFPCTHYSLFNENLNYAHRMEELELLREQDQPLLDFAYDVCMRQIEGNRFFILENPLRSRLWEQEKMQRLLQVPGVGTTIIDSGAYGAENSKGMPIMKPFKLMSNSRPHLEALVQRLTPEQKHYCQPVCGGETKSSQVYPPGMVHTVLGNLRKLAKQNRPHRFADAHNVLVQRPVDDIRSWEPILDEITPQVGRGSTRPFLISIDSDLGVRISDLARMNLQRIQVAPVPTTRRFPTDVPFTHRGALLLYNDNSKELESEDVAHIRFPKQRFSRPVRLAVFFYGSPRESEDPDVEEPTDPGVPLPGLVTDISFPGIPPDVPQEVRRSVARLHTNLGHPTQQEMIRMLAYQGTAPTAVITAVKALSCATCTRMRMPQKPRPSATTSTHVGQLGDEVQIDNFYIRTLDGVNHCIMGASDRATRPSASLTESLALRLRH